MLGAVLPKGTEIPWQYVLIRRARALQAGVPPWVLTGVDWHKPGLRVANFWGIWCNFVEGIEAEAQSDREQPAGELAAVVAGGRLLGTKNREVE